MPRPRIRGRALRFDERGLALPSLVTLIAGAAVVILAIVFVTTLGGGSKDAADDSPTQKPSVPSKITNTPTPDASTSATPSSKPQPSKTPKPSKAPLPTVDRSRYPLSIFNTTSTSGLAASVASKAESKGWTVHGTGNWNGNVPTTTVYYPDGMSAAAKVLAHDLGIDRVVSASAGNISIVRLSVILTGPLG